ncbi:MAG: hypothetical protein V7752_16015 [Halopseudomonas sp.]
MQHIITFQLSPPNSTLDYVRSLPGMSGVEIDESYGLVAISPKRQLYVVRASDPIDQDSVLAIPEVKGIYGDVNIAPIAQSAGNEED